MIRLYAGEDSYESYINALQFTKKLSEKKNLEIKKVNADEISNPSEFSLLVEGVGMFSSESIIFAKRVLKNKNLVEYLVENFERFNQFEIVIWTDDKADGKTKLVKKLKDNKTLFNFELPKEWQFNSWIENAAKKKDIKFSKDQINYIIERLGVNKWIILNELKKISLFLKSKINHPSSGISDQELAKILGFEANGDIWKFLDFFGEKNKQKALSEFLKLSKYENNVQYFIAMILRELNLISKVKYVESSNSDYKLLKLHPFVLQKTIKKARNFSFEDIKNLLQSLENIDYNIKSGRFSEKLGMIYYLTTN